jgi:hypothetical protein
MQGRFQVAETDILLLFSCRYRDNSMYGCVLFLDFWYGFQENLPNLVPSELFISPRDDAKTPQSFAREKTSASRDCLPCRNRSGPFMMRDSGSVKLNWSFASGLLSSGGWPLLAQKLRFRGYWPLLRAIPGGGRNFLGLLSRLSASSKGSIAAYSSLLGTTWPSSGSKEFVATSKQKHSCPPEPCLRGPCEGSHSSGSDAVKTGDRFPAVSPTWAAGSAR